MLACSLVHEGESALSLSRIQILDDAFGSFPTDIEIAMCQQRENPECYLACPFQDGALCIDEKTGVRYINEKECTGCQHLLLLLWAEVALGESHDGFSHRTRFPYLTQLLTTTFAVK